MLNARCIGTLSAEWELSGEQVVGDDRQTVVVTGRFSFALSLFWSHIFRCAKANACLGELFLVGKDACNAKIGQQEPVIVTQEHIAWLNVAMYYPLCMGIVDGLCCLREISDGLGYWY